MLVGPLVTLPTEAARVDHDGRTVWLWGLYPLYEAEIAYKTATDADSLFELLFDAEICEGVHPGRPAVVRPPERRRGWLCRR